MHSYMSRDTQKGSLTYFFSKFSFHRISKELLIPNNLRKYGGRTSKIDNFRVV